MTKERGQMLCDALAVAMAKRSGDPRIIVDWPMQPAVDRVILAEAETAARNAALEEAAVKAEEQAIRGAVRSLEGTYTAKASRRIAAAIRSLDVEGEKK